MAGSGHPRRHRSPAPTLNIVAVRPFDGELSPPSTVTICPATPSVSMVATVWAADSASLRYLPATVAPSAANARPVARPIPRLPR